MSIRSEPGQQVRGETRATQPLHRLAKTIRSKNAGPFRLTLDILFKERAVYEQVKRRLAATVERLRREEAAAQRAQLLAAEAKFDSLASRVHPHFLFNALHTVLVTLRVQETLKGAHRLVVDGAGAVELAMSAEASTGFLSWVESAPPGLHRG